MSRNFNGNIGTYIEQVDTLNQINNIGGTNNANDVLKELRNHLSDNEELRRKVKDLEEEMKLGKLTEEREGYWKTVLTTGLTRAAEIATIGSLIAQLVIKG